MWCGTAVFLQCSLCLPACLVPCRSLPQYQDGSVDAILDKGTLDSLMCGEHAGDNTLQMVEECHRCDTCSREGRAGALAAYAAGIYRGHGGQDEWGGGGGGHRAHAAHRDAEGLAGVHSIDGGMGSWRHGVCSWRDAEGFQAVRIRLSVAKMTSSKSAAAAVLRWRLPVLQRHLGLRDYSAQQH